jgi:NADPH:quinone reductase-like Zn-dependent oxidoreductase
MATVDRGGVKTSEWVAIVGANGAVGSASTQIAAAMGANVIAVVRDSSLDDQIDRTKVAAIAHLDTDDLPGLVGTLTGGKGVNLAINGVGANVFPLLFDCLAPFGRMSIFSILGGREVTLDLQTLYRKNITLHGINSVDFDATESASILRKMMPMIESGVLTAPDPARRFPLSKAPETYQTISGGKTVLIADRFFR